MGVGSNTVPCQKGQISLVSLSLEHRNQCGVSESALDWKSEGTCSKPSAFNKQHDLEQILVFLGFNFLIFQVKVELFRV